MVRILVEHGACIFATTLSDQETAAEKCEEDEDGYDGCSDYLYSEYKHFLTLQLFPLYFSSQSLVALTTGFRIFNIFVELPVLEGLALLAILRSRHHKYDFLSVNSNFICYIIHSSIAKP